MSDSPAIPKSCPKCGADLPSAATEGLCPRCILSQAMHDPAPKTPAGRWEPPTAEELQKLLPQYEIIALLGRGGMGAVYKGRQLSLDRPVAIKILSNDLEAADASFAERFKNEARSMARLNHPGIVAVHDFGETSSGLLYIVMEFIEGTDVSRMIAQQKRLHTEHAMAITAHVCDALAYAHERGIIHRDIKPANIMVSYDGVVKVADFGLAKMNSKAGDSVGLTQSGMAMGTLHFMAPEALMLGTAVDHRADIYAVGVMLYQMLTGKLPHGIFELPSLQVSGLDPRYDGIIAKAMREDRDIRYQNATQMRFDLDHILTQPVVKVEPDTPVAPAALPTAARPQRPAGQPYRAPQQQVVLSAKKKDTPVLWMAVLALGAAAAWLYWDRSNHPPSAASTVDSSVPQNITAPDGPAVAAPPPKRAVKTSVEPPSSPQSSSTAPPSNLKVPALPSNGWRSLIADGSAFKSSTQISQLPDGSWHMKPCFVKLTEARDAAIRVRGRMGENGTLSLIVRWDESATSAPHGYRTTFNALPEFNRSGGNVLLANGMIEGGKSTAGQLTPQIGAIVGTQPRATLPKDQDYEMELRCAGSQISILLNGKLMKTAEVNVGAGTWLAIDSFRQSEIKTLEWMPLDPTGNPLANATLPTGPTTWTDTKGRSITATFKRMEGDNVMLDIAGKLTPVAMGTLSAESQKLAKDLQGVASPPTAVNLVGLWKQTNNGKSSPFYTVEILSNNNATFTGADLRLSGTWSMVAGELIMNWDNGSSYRLAVPAEPTPAVLLGTATLKNGKPPFAIHFKRGTVGATAATAAITKDSPFVNTLGMKFVPVPGTNVHMCIHETRRKDYAAYAAANAGVDPTWQNPVVNAIKLSTGVEHPVSSVSWEDAIAFCDWLGKKEGRVYRLPTGYEWDLAVVKNLDDRSNITSESVYALVKSQYPWDGNDNDSRPPDDAGRYRDSGKQFQNTAPVMSFKPNALGIYDLGGNVWEWCQDLAKDKPGERLFRGAGYENWGGIIKSNAWGVAPKTDRNTTSADSYPRSIGFRIVIEDDDKNSITSPASSNASVAPLIPATSVAQPAPVAASATATKDKPFTNSLCMQFVPVPGTKTLFCIHETRRQDYAAYATEMPGVDGTWKTANFSGIPCGHENAHPVCSVSWNDAKAFCAWLSKKKAVATACQRTWSGALRSASGVKRAES